MVVALMMSVDVESRSEIDLTRVGVTRYAKHPSTDLICASFDLGPVYYNWRYGEPLNPFVRDYMASGAPMAAYNAMFEWNLFTYVGHHKYGWPLTKVDQWVCTAAQAACMATPRRLDHVGDFLGLSVLKDTVGKKVMMKLSRPDKTGKLVNGTPAELQVVCDYCQQDVAAEKAIAQAIRPMQPIERPVWLQNQKINQRGFYVDTDFAKSALDLWETHFQQINDEVRAITKAHGGIEISATQVAVLTDWINAECQAANIYFGSIGKDLVQEKLKSCPHMPSHVRRVLELRLEAGCSAVKKYQSFLDVADPVDKRARDCFSYHGASTGREAGRLIQPQNLSKGILLPEEIQGAMDLVRRKDTSNIRMLWGSVSDVLGSLCRPTIQAPPGKKLVVSDFAAIEARGVAWLAGQGDALTDFQNKKDAYIKMASTIYGKPEALVTDSERFMGKQVVLGSGYQMGPVKFRNMLRQKYDVEITEQFAKQCIDVYRASNREIVNLWYSLERAMVACIQTGEPTRYRHIQFHKDGDWTFLTLPSGRDLAYFKCELYEGSFQRMQIRYLGVDGESGRARTEHTYGGRITENACQAHCRDLLIYAEFTLEHAGYPVVGCVHDEIITEVDEAFGSPQHVETLMSRAPSWCSDFPLAAKAWEGRFFRK